MFLKEEKVFSLSTTAAAVPYGNITELFQEFYCYLLVAGLYREGENPAGVRLAETAPMADRDFALSSSSYRAGFTRFLNKGLVDRYRILSNHPDLSPREDDILTSINGLFTDQVGYFTSLTGRDLMSIAHLRHFSDDMLAVAHYVAVAFGQSDYPIPGEVPKLYISKFGNIHLSKNEKVTLDTPTLRYGDNPEPGIYVTALWAMLSAVSNLHEIGFGSYPGDALGDWLSELSFLSERDEFSGSLPIPRYASTLYMQQRLHGDSPNPISVASSFYKDFFFGSLQTLKLSRQQLLSNILDLMVEKSGESNVEYLFSPNSYYPKLLNTSQLRGSQVARPVLLQFALEAMDSAGYDPTGAAPEGDDDKEGDLAPGDIKGYDPTDTPDKDDDVDANTDDAPADDDDDELGEQATPGDDAEQDPQTDVGGYDPSTPPAIVPTSSAPDSKDTIDLISFDTSGEGVNEDLYRAAVVALNDRLQSDDTLPITAEVKDQLNHWVGGFLYRAAITATQSQIKFLNLQKHLKTVSIKG